MYQLRDRIRSKQEWYKLLQNIIVNLINIVKMLIQDYLSLYILTN